jgi:anti-sigma regulatory factor (Ser/Thr protein kinase)
MALTALEVSTLVPLPDDSAAGEARRAARRLAGELGIDEVTAERAAIVATEAARNAVRHGGGGMLILRGLGPPERGGVELLALDRGPGIPDLAAALRDGYSTAGTPGHGLGAMSRLATRFEVWSAPGAGTAVLAHVRRAPATADDDAVGAVCLPMRGETACGDRWVVLRRDGRTLCAVVDGIGHGPLAADAAHAAVRALEARPVSSAAEAAETCHLALRATRGAALAVAVARDDQTDLAYAGVGNVSGTVLVDGLAPRRLVSLAGTAGHAIRTVQEFGYPFPAGALLVMHSDGLTTSWTLDRYPGLALRHPSLVAGVLYRDAARGRDDVSVLVARRGPP